jgi:hypothetical protein
MRCCVAVFIWTFELLGNSLSFSLHKDQNATLEYVFSLLYKFLSLPLWSSGQSSWLQNGDILCFLWGTNWIYICYVEGSRPPLWSSGQRSWLQIQRSGFDSRRYHIFWEEVGLERGPLSLVSTTEELLGRKSWGSDLESREYGRRDPSCWPRGTLYPQKLALTSPTSDGRSVGIVRSRTQATEFFFLQIFNIVPCNGYADPYPEGQGGRGMKLTARLNLCREQEWLSCTATLPYVVMP